MSDNYDAEHGGLLHVCQLYHGDLETFYYHSLEDTNRNKVRRNKVPARFLNRPLYSEDMEELRWELNILRADGTHYGNPTVIKYLRECGYDVSDPIKDRMKMVG